MTTANTFRSRKEGRWYDVCRTCKRAAGRRYQRKKNPVPKTKFAYKSPQRLRVQAALFRNATLDLPDTPYRRAMVEAFALYDAWDLKPRSISAKLNGRKPKQRKAA